MLASGTVPFRGESEMLPGAFVGVLLGGGNPLEAGAAQLLVLIGLLATEMLAIRAVTELVGRGALLDDVPR